ncbi:hypothetical protein EXM90_19080 [Clostridium botulinum]|uniref:hypothetical protein n=1 Tax=Clostridium botulinum TaxID=1491 RepID=UPI000465055F|nr:hypothetical protein [Clostridium botulinum]APR02454.1 hypothetical protein RSJ2_3955 [Clostridium botulinum]MBN3367031.1 hypothetical protein [Clostridium botulinum]MBN3371667.1 hypothetical protein [Clostridium botulinum]MBN3375527.1 hypothetical protein [Clostridium botulinum]MBN3384184.1 hypothetical protein [Clostridium botulinum]
MKTCKTQEQFQKEVYDLVGDEYSVLGKYIKGDIKITMKHNKCEHEWDVIPNKFLQSTRCPKCHRGGKKSHQKFVEEVHELVGDEYTVIGKYKKSNEKIRMKHNICGYDEWDVVPDNFLRGTRCPKCAYERISKAQIERHKKKK